MAICSAPNCSSNNERGIRCFKFPADPARASIWLLNCGRNKWSPSPNSRLCEVHFDENQWERRRVDGWKKLKPNAIPTIFTQNPPQNLMRQNQVSPVRMTSNSKVRVEVVAVSTPATTTIRPSVVSPTVAPEARVVPTYHDATILSLQQELSMLKKKLAEKDEELKTLLTNEQSKALHNYPSPWSPEGIIQGLKFRHGLGVHGYHCHRSTDYPRPTYSTLLQRFRHFETEFGIFENLREPLIMKVDTLNSSDRFCSLSIDKMEISGKIDYDKGKYAYLGHVTLGDSEIVGSHVTVVMVNDLRGMWEQVIACEISGPSTTEIHYKDLIERCILFVEDCGLEVISVSSNVDSNNEAMWMWSALGLEVTRSKLERKLSFPVHDHEVYVVPDVSHLLINLMFAVRNSNLQLPQSVIDAEGLSSAVVSGIYLLELWNLEVTKDDEQCSLKHLQIEDIEPNLFSYMNLSSAERYFSDETAAALEYAVERKLLSPYALTTAFFCRLIHDWFSICASKGPKAGINNRNKATKFQRLHRIVEIFQNHGVSDGMALNTGMILATLSLCTLTSRLMEEGFQFVTLDRFSQDALENVFDEVRNIAGVCPSALECIRALKPITMSQFVSGVPRVSQVGYSNTLFVKAPSLVGEYDAITVDST